MWSACFTSCATGEKTQGISAEAQRRFDYYYAEAVKSKLAGRYDDSFELYKHCLDIKPDAAEALYNLGLYYLPDARRICPVRWLWSQRIYIIRKPLRLFICATGMM